MSTIISERPSIACPNWCESDHGDDEKATDAGHVIVHDGRTETVAACTVEFEGRTDPFTMTLTRSNLLDGTVVASGMRLGDHFFTDAVGKAALEGLLSDLRLQGVTSDAATS